MTYHPVWRCDAAPDCNAREAIARFAASRESEPDPAGFDSSWHFRLVGDDTLYRLRLTSDDLREVYEVVRHDPEPLPEGAP